MGSRLTNRFAKTFRGSSEKIFKASRLDVPAATEEELQEDLTRGLATVNACLPATEFSLDDLPEGLETLLLVSALWHHLLIQKILLDTSVLDQPIDLLREVMRAQAAVKASLFVDTA